MSQNLQGANGLTFAANSGALAVGTTASGYTNGAAINYSIAGRFASKAIVASVLLAIEPGSGIDPTLPNAFKTLAKGESCAFSVLLDNAGVFTVMQGDVVSAGYPTPVSASNEGKAIVGAIKVVNATNPFIPGTTNFTATGVTTTFVNLSQHPGTSI
jgi:hypothetical protein